MFYAVTLVRRAAVIVHQSKHDDVLKDARYTPVDSRTINPAVRRVECSRQEVIVSLPTVHVAPADDCGGRVGEPLRGVSTTQSAMMRVHKRSARIERYISAGCYHAAATDLFEIADILRISPLSDVLQLIFRIHQYTINAYRTNDANANRTRYKFEIGSTPSKLGSPTESQSGSTTGKFSIS